MGKENERLSEWGERMKSSNHSEIFTETSERPRIMAFSCFMSPGHIALHPPQSTIPLLHATAGDDVIFILWQTFAFGILFSGPFVNFYYFLAKRKLLWHRMSEHHRENLFRKFLISVFLTWKPLNVSMRELNHRFESTDQPSRRANDGGHDIPSHTQVLF